MHPGGGSISTKDWLTPKVSADWPDLVVLGLSDLSCKSNEYARISMLSRHLRSPKPLYCEGVKALEG